MCAKCEVGDKLIVGAGFDCMSEGEIKVVRADERGELYIECGHGDGKHFLCGQIDDYGRLVGLAKVTGLANWQPEKGVIRQ